MDYLLDAKLALYIDQVSIRGNRVTFNQSQRDQPFLLDRSHPGVDQYLAWIAAGAYSAALYDGSLLQFTYDVEAGHVVSHRLAYVPCPYRADHELLKSGEPFADVMELYRDSEVLLRTPIRFDFDPAASRSGHPAAHMTINGSDCRIACVAPIHPLRFTDFVFRHFYTDQWLAHEPYFRPANYQHFGPAVLTEAERITPHIVWDVHAQHSS
ncbi:DUF2290 domain-containing protein [Mycolicibacterium fortuitum]|uniref:DUF2290 domain-containing protein n=1 Tax=Mycolicibacterium fortuitum TaxID=1766 RepID=UPI000944F950|nr:DUF2290 domain-containing protein [Mycolicibacterium fortuitum]